MPTAVRSRQEPCRISCATQSQCESTSCYYHTIHTTLQIAKSRYRAVQFDVWHAVQAAVTAADPVPWRKWHVLFNAYAPFFSSFGALYASDMLFIAFSPTKGLRVQFASSCSHTSMFCRQRKAPQSEHICGGQQL
jgi:hypothetical protein